MRLCSRAVLPVVLLILVSAASLLADDLPDFLQREGSLFAAFQAPLSSQVYLDAVVVDKIKGQNSPPYFTVRELFAPSEKLVILSQPSSLLKLGQIIDVEGTLASLPSGELALENVTVWGYADETGALVDGPLKGLYSRTPWDNNMIDLTVASDYYSGSSSNMTASDSFSNEEPNTSPLPEPTFYPTIAGLLTAGSAQSQTNNGMTAQTYYDGIGDISGSDGDPVEIGCDAITEVGSDGSYFVATDSSGSIPVYCTTDRLTGVTTDDRVNHILGQLRHVDDNPIICIDDGPGYDPTSVANPVLQIVKAGGISWAKTFADSTTLPSSLTDKIVSQAFPSAGYFYIQEPMRQSGIRVYNQSAASSVSPGTVVTVSGAISTQDGERMITASNVVTTSSTDAPLTLGMTNRALGGGPVNAYTAGITSCQEMPNQGLLARIWGKVTYSDSNYFYLDDGSNIDNGTGNPLGVKVSWAWHGSQDGDAPIAVPGQDWYVSASGISSSEVVLGQTVRVLRLRRQEDLKVVTPEDNSNPYVDMTTPPDGQLSLASNSAGQYNAVLAGTATDADTGVVKVEVGFTTTTDTTGPATWSRADYNSTSHVWTYNWSSPTTSKIWVRATDFAFHQTTINRVVTVSTTPVNVIYVSESGDNTDGSSWTHAKTTVTAGLTAATSGKEVWVAQGKYLENVILKAGVKMYGGFVGGSTNETYREQRNWKTNRTILDGNSAGTVVTVGSGATATTTLIDGFIIQNGKYAAGAGIRCYDCSATISHNIIRMNIATASYGSCSGAGIYCQYYSTPSVPVIADNLIVNNVVSDNYYGTGGGILIGGYGTAATVVNNTIAYNSALTAGGMNVGFFGNGVVTVSNNIVACNSSGIRYSGNPIITYNDVWNNRDDASSSIYWKPGNPETNHNITSNPQFLKPDYGDYHIISTSPCKDAGLDSVTLPDSLDIDNGSRRNGVIDIGSDEWNGVDPVPAVITVRVKPDGSNTDPTHDGSTWALAKQTIQAAVNAVSDAGGGEIWVKGATGNGIMYREPIVLPAFAYLYGGFDESDQSLQDRDWATDLTILDGTALGTNVVTVGTTCGRTACVDGFTIQNGYGSGIQCNAASVTIANNTIKQNRGAGIGCSGSADMLINNNTVTTNSAGGIVCGLITSGTSEITGNTVTGNIGTGILSSGGAATVTYNTVSGNNSSVQGGGIYVSACNGLRATVDHNTVTGNGTGGGNNPGTGNGGGGGIAVMGLVTVTNNTVSNNTVSGTACFGGGILVDTFWTGEIISYNTITGNRCLGSCLGGGIACTYHAAQTSGNVQVDHNTITGNTAYSGGGVYLYGCSVQAPTYGTVLELDSNTIQSNVASNEGGGVLLSGASYKYNVIGNKLIANTGSAYGGGIAIDTAITGSTTIVNNLLVGNVTTISGAGGGGLYAADSAPAIVNNTFVNNIAVTNGLGGAIRLQRRANNVIASSTIKNNIFFDNRALQGWSVFSDLALTSQVAFSDAFNPNTNNDPSSHYVVAGVDSVNSWIGYADPMFALIPQNGGNPDYINGDYHLQALSPCIDNGLNPDQITGLAQILNSDIEGNTRPVDIIGVPNYSTTAYADPGAYEKQ